MKRSLVFCILVAMMVCGLSTFALATETDFRTIQNEEITDVDILYQRAKNGITDLHLEQVPKAELKNVKTGEILDVDTFSTTQLLEAKTLGDGKQQKIYATTTFADVGPDSDPVKWPKEDWDKTISVRAWITLYIKVYEHDRIEYWGLQGAEGGWDNIDPSRIKIIKREKVTGQSGTKMNGRPFQDKVGPGSTSNLFFDNTSPWSTEANAVCTVSNHVLGCTTKATMQAVNGGSTWALQLSHTRGGQLTL